MSRPKLEVNEVYILQEVMPYEGSIILGVFVDLDVAKRGRKWKQDAEGDWQTSAPEFAPFFLITKHAIRTK